MRYDEDFRFLSDADCKTQRWDKYKYIALGRDDRFVAIGGDARIRYERFENPGFGREVQDYNGYLLQRYLGHVDYHLNDRWRFFGQLESSSVNGRRAGPRETDRNDADINQLFAQWTPYRHDDNYTSIRAGRQEVEIGSAQFTSARDGLNDRLSFDGIRTFGEIEGWRFHVMATRVVRTSRSFFDDRSAPDETLSGYYVARAHGLTPGGNGVVYMSRRTRPVTAYSEGTAREERDTIGTRWWDRGERWDYDWEVGTQIGSYGSGDIRAWYLRTDTGYSSPTLKLRPRFGVRFAIGSGDSQRGDGHLGTFSPLFASTAYSGLVGLIGPSNSVSLAPSMQFRVAETQTLTFGVIGFWRQTTGDGIYNIFSDVQRDPGLSNARHVGTQATVSYNWQYSPNVTLVAVGSYFVTGKFLKETPPGENVTYFTTWWAYRF